MDRTTENQTRLRKVMEQTDAELEAEMALGAAAEAADRQAGLRATTANYDEAMERIVLELSNGTAFAFPAAMVPGLTAATSALRASLTLTPSGSAVEWTAINVDVSVPGILAATVGRAIISASGRAGGSVKSAAKAEAARENGRKGGRPRKELRVKGSEGPLVRRKDHPDSAHQRTKDGWAQGDRKSEGLVVHLESSSESGVRPHGKTRGTVPK